MCAPCAYVYIMTQQYKSKEWSRRPAAVAAEAVKGVPLCLPSRPRHPVNPSAHHVHPC